MDPYLVDVVLLRQMIEHRLTGNHCTMAEAINQVAWEAEMSPRHANRVLMGDYESPAAVEKLEAALTRLSDDEGGVPFMCCTPEAVHIIKRELRYHH